ncbi:MAG: hypothetical protein ACE5KG_06265 [Nitrososphaerales archaeon]
MEIIENYSRCEATAKQVQAFQKLAKELEDIAEVVDYYSSDEYVLPVVRFFIHPFTNNEGAVKPAGTFILRDNFHDVNLYAQLRSPLDLPLSAFFEGVKEPKDWDWYLRENWELSSITWEGYFRPGVKIYLQHKPSCQGMTVGKDVPRKYIPGMTEFVIKLDSLDDALVIMKRIGAELS